MDFILKGMSTRGKAHASEDKKTRDSAVERHNGEVSELRRFFNLLVRGMEVKTWRLGQQAGRTDLSPGCVSEELRALGASVLDMMDDGAATTKEEAYEILWMPSDEASLCIDKQKTHSKSQRSADCITFPLTLLKDPEPIDMGDARFYAILIESSDGQSVVIGVPTDRCRSLMLLHLGRVMAAYGAVEENGMVP